MAEARSQAAQESARIRALVEALDDLDDLELSHLTLSNSHDHNGRRLMQNGGPPAYGGARLLQQANSPPSYGGRRSLLQVWRLPPAWFSTWQLFPASGRMLNCICTDAMWQH
eukprot:365313-Chlamydomonas_euryale.AAC.16